MKTLKEVLEYQYYTKTYRQRKPSNINKMSWFITDDRNVVNDRINLWNSDKHHYYAVNDKRVVEIDVDGNGFFICPCTAGTKDANKMLEKGWEMIPDENLDVYVRELS